jgi:hypothetical protein
VIATYNKPLIAEGGCVVVKGNLALKRGSDETICSNSCIDET